jgi:hypothetical protein
MEQEQAAEIKLAAGAEGSTPQPSSVSTGGSGGEPTVAMAGGEKGGGAKPPTSNQGTPAGQPTQREAPRRQRSEHAEQRRTERRRVGPVFNDAQRARPADVYVQEDGRYVVRGPRGREHIFEPDGTHVTSIDRSQSAHQAIVARGDRRPISLEEFERFRGILK